ALPNPYLKIPPVPPRQESGLRDLHTDGQSRGRAFEEFQLAAVRRFRLPQHARCTPQCRQTRRQRGGGKGVFLPSQSAIIKYASGLAITSRQSRPIQPSTFIAVSWSGVACS